MGNVSLEGLVEDSSCGVCDIFKGWWHSRCIEEQIVGSIIGDCEGLLEPISFEDSLNNFSIFMRVDCKALLQVEAPFALVLAPVCIEESTDSVAEAVLEHTLVPVVNCLVSPGLMQVVENTPAVALVGCPKTFELRYLGLPVHFGRSRPFYLPLA